MQFPNHFNYNPKHKNTLFEEKQELIQKKHEKEYKNIVLNKQYFIEWDGFWSDKAYKKGIEAYKNYDFWPLEDNKGKLWGTWEEVEPKHAVFGSYTINIYVKTEAGIEQSLEGVIFDIPPVDKKYWRESPHQTKTGEEMQKKAEGR